MKEYIVRSTFPILQIAILLIFLTGLPVFILASNNRKFLLNYQDEVEESHNRRLMGFFEDNPDYEDVSQPDGGAAAERELVYPQGVIYSESPEPGY